MRVIRSGSVIMCDQKFVTSQGQKQIDQQLNLDLPQKSDALYLIVPMVCK